MSWAEAARDVIARIDAELPAAATLKDRRKALRAAAGDFHMGTSWGKKVWSKEARRYLERHGLPLREAADSPNFGSDIIFPFRAGEAA